MAHRDPYLVLGIEPGASIATVKAAWRKLARQHHPDLSGGDAAVARAATRRMAEINAAYEQLRDPVVDPIAGGRGRDGTGKRDGATDRADVGSTGAGTDRPADGSRTGRTGGPPPPRPTRPVTARLDTTDTLRPRNATTASSGGGRARPPVGQPPIRSRASEMGPRRASDPNGPLIRSRLHRFRAPVPPSLQVAQAVELSFGKFHGHTLGDVAGFEPSYVDWLAGSLLRDPDLAAAARVIRAELDRRGIVRRVRVAPGRSSLSGTGTD